MRRGLNGFTRWPFRDVGDSVFYHSLSGLASGHSGRLAHTATIRPLGCSRKMRPLAFLDPSLHYSQKWNAEEFFVTARCEVDEGRIWLDRETDSKVLSEVHGQILT